MISKRCSTFPHSLIVLKRNILFIIGALRMWKNCLHGNLELRILVLESEQRMKIL